MAVENVVDSLAARALERVRQAEAVTAGLQREAHELAVIKAQERAARGRLMRLLAAKLRDMSEKRSAFDKAQISMMLNIKRQEEAQQKAEEEAAIAHAREEKERELTLREGKKALKNKAEELLAGAGVDVGQQEALLGDNLVLLSREYACVRMLQTFDMVIKPISDGVKRAMRQHTWPGQSWSKHPERIWLGECRDAAGEKDRPKPLKEDKPWALPILTKIMKVFGDVMLEAAAVEIREEERASGQFQRSVHHIMQLHRNWQWMVQGHTVETEIIFGILGIAHVCHVLGCPEAVALRRLAEDLEDVRQREQYAAKVHAEVTARRTENMIASKRVFKLFKEIDVDGSGDLDKSELKTMAEQAGMELSDKELERIVVQMDENSDGSISPEEFETWWQVNLLAEMVAEAIDEDDEGHVMQEELEMLFEKINGLVSETGREDKVIDTKQKALSVCAEAGIGEFVAIEELAHELVNIYGCDKVLFTEIEELANKLPDPLSRGMPSIHCAAMRLLQAMDSCEVEIKTILVENQVDLDVGVFKLEEYRDEDDGEIRFDLSQICDVLIAQNRRRGVVPLLSSANMERLAELCRTVREYQPQLLFASTLGWDWMIQGVDAALGLVSFFKTANKNIAESCRDAVLGMRDVGTRAGASQSLIAAVGSGKFSSGGLGGDDEMDCKIVGRDNLLVTLCRAITNDGSSVLIHGRHGVGKTALLMECNRRLRDGFEYSGFISALTEVSLYEGLLRFAQANIEAVPADAPLNAAVIQSVKEWLLEEEDWLFIVDNAHYPDKLLDIFPESRGHVIFADDSYPGWHVHSERMTLIEEVGPLTTASSIELLNSIVPPKLKEQLEYPHLDEFLEDMVENLPLSVCLAGKLLAGGMPMDTIWETFGIPDEVLQVEEGLVIDEGDRPQHGVYKIIVATGYVKGSGTDSNVCIQLLGRNEGAETSSPVFRLDGNNAIKSDKSHMNKFECGHKDEFRHVEEVPLGDVVGIRIGQDSSGLASDWYLDKIDVVHEATADRWVFIDGGWLKKEELVNRNYKCIRKVDTTAEDHPSSQKIGELRPGDTILVGEAPARIAMNSKGKMSNQRVHFSRGDSVRWVDLEDSKGRPYLEDLGCPLEEVEEPGFGKLLLREMSIRDESAGTMTGYAIEFTTGSVAMAGTDAEVFVNIIGSKGDTGEIHIESQKKDFENGDTNTFNVYGRDVGKVKKLKVWHDGTGHGAGWYLESAAVTNKRSWKHWEFPCDQWMDVKKGDGSLCRELISGAVDTDDAFGYHVTVKTGSQDNAGTDANVYIDLCGTKGPSGARRLDHPKHDDFEEGAEDTYKINVSDLGRLESIRVWHDNKGFGAAWYLCSIMVVDRRLWRRYHFPCEKWFDKNKKRSGDGLFDRVLEPDDSTVDVVPYEIVVSTGDYRNAGTDANVFIEIFGSDNESGERLLDADGDEFERGGLDKFVITCPSLGDDISSFKLWHDNSGLGPGWFVDELKIINRNTLKCWTMPVFQWFDTGEGDMLIERTFEIEEEHIMPLVIVPYQVDVFTGDVVGAGTDANIFIQIFGQNGDSGRQVLNDETKDGFERNMHDYFRLELPDLGPLSKIVIGHDGAGTGSAWFLQKVCITNPVTTQRYICPAYEDSTVWHGTWLDDREYEGISKEGLMMTIEAVVEIDVDGKPKLHVEVEPPSPAHRAIRILSDLSVEHLEVSLQSELEHKAETLEARKLIAIKRGDFELNQELKLEIDTVRNQIPGVCVQPKRLLFALASLQDVPVPVFLFDNMEENGAPEAVNRRMDAIAVQPALGNFWDVETFEKSLKVLRKAGLVDVHMGYVNMHGQLQRQVRRIAEGTKEEDVVPTISQILKNRVIRKVGKESQWPKVLPLLSCTRAAFRREDCPMIDSAESSWSIGRMLEEHGFDEDAVTLYNYAMYAYHHELGPVHPRTMTVYNNLAGEMEHILIHLHLLPHDTMHLLPQHFCVDH